MTEEEARRCAAILREHWPEEYLQLTIEKPCVDNGMEHVLRLVLPQQPLNQRQMRMRHPQQLVSAQEKLRQVLGRASAAIVAQCPKKRKTYQWKSGSRPPRLAKGVALAQVATLPAPPGPPIRWEHGDVCEVVGRHDGPFTVLAMVNHQTLLCQRMNGTLLHCQVGLARPITRG